MKVYDKKNVIKYYRGSPLSTIFGTWKKSYYAKFVLFESISTSTNLPSKSPASTNIDYHQFIPLHTTSSR